MSDPRMLWCDVETTGLADHGPGGLYRNGLLLEVALVLTTPSLDVLSTHHTVIHYPRWALDARRATVSPAVEEMHARSGLWADVAAAGRDLAAAEATAVAWLDANQVTDRLPLCGSSVHTDLEWLKHRWPIFHSRLHYRVIDVSSFKEVAWRLSYPAAPKGDSRHRALADITDSIVELRHYRATMLRAIRERPTMHRANC